MGCADACCWYNDSPAGVVNSRQVSLYSIEPSGHNLFLSESANRFEKSLKAVFVSGEDCLHDFILCCASDDIHAGNLFPEHDRPAAGFDEAVELGPQVPLIAGSESFSGAGEGLAWR